MKIRIIPGKTTAQPLFAAEELIKFMSMVWNEEYSISQKAEEGALCIFLSSGNSIDDSYSIESGNQTIRISGSNDISMLIGCYRFLEAIGFRFPAPGINILPSNPVRIEDIQVSISSSASLRHRGIAIEGANSLANVLDMIDWLPKAGFNSYFLQFEIPYTFFAKWYQHEENPLLDKEPFSQSDALRFKDEIETESAKRGLHIHSVGHGWTAKAIGLDALGWDKDNAADFDADKTALINGRRGLFEGVAINTNLCYSDAANIKRMVEVVLDYAIRHPLTDVLHIWLADGWNNFCECPGCIGEMPADQYIRILNCIDEAFAANKIEMKICFLIYYDLLWPPVKEKLNNPDRFIMMFAPISRTFESSYKEAEADDSIPEYKKNQITLPKDINANLAFLKAWQDTVECDSFDFDYPLGRAHYGDPGYEKVSRIISEDIKSLKRLGLNGYISCQEQRAAFPTALPDYIMGRTLWDIDTDFEDAATRYYMDAFSLSGSAASGLRDILCRISMAFNMDFFNANSDGGNIAESMLAIPELAEKLSSLIEQNLMRDDLQYGQKEMWRRLGYLPQYVRLFSACFRLKAERKDASEAFAAFRSFVTEHELELQKALDAYRLLKLSREYAGFENRS